MTLAIISSHGDGCEKDLVTNNKNGFFIEKMTLENLAEKIRQLHNDRNILSEFKANSKQGIDEKYNIETYMKEIFNAIQSK